MKKLKVIAISCLLVGLGLAGCSSGSGGGDDGGGSGGSGGTTSLNTIDDLPKATAPVVEGSSGLIVKGKDATTGVVLGGISSSTFDAQSSVAACEATMRFKESISAAAQGDLILCYVQNIMAADSDSGVDIYDGEYHIFDLAFDQAADEMEGGPSRVKMRIVKNSGGAITDFEMFACGDSGSADEQSEYLHQTIGSDGSFSMTSKGFFGGGEGGENGHQVSVSGTLNSSGQFTSKTIQTSYTYSGGWGNGEGGSTVVQGSDTITFDGFETGSFSDNGNEGSYTNRAYAEAQLIDPNTAGSEYNLQILAIGDGAAHVLMGGEVSSDMGNFSWNEDAVQGWNGDTTEEDAEAAASYITAVSGETPAAISDVSISFGTSETYDCTGTADGTVTVDQEGLDTSCSNLDLGHEWVNCWEATGQETEQ